VLWYASSWHKTHLESPHAKAKGMPLVLATHKHRKQLYAAFGLVIMLAFARSWYFVGITNYYALYQMKALGTDYQWAQILVFTFMACAALGTLFGGKFSELFGMKRSLMVSMIIAAPLTIALPYSTGFGTMIILGIVGFVLLSTWVYPMPWCYSPDKLVKYRDLCSV
jgi:FSR family fosmidomycin resistance protein-like MFS transporter